MTTDPSTERYAVFVSGVRLGDVGGFAAVAYVVGTGFQHCEVSGSADGLSAVEMEVEAVCHAIRRLPERAEFDCYLSPALLEALADTGTYGDIGISKVLATVGLREPNFILREPCDEQDEADRIALASAKARN